jgi:exodeoxyribonuclease V alpha subunit
VAGWFDERPSLWAALDASARDQAAHAHPDHAVLSAAAGAAQRAHEQARHVLVEAHRHRVERLDRFGPAARDPDPEARLAELERDIATTRQELANVRARIASLKAEQPALTQPADRLAQEHDAWRDRQNAGRAARRAREVWPTATQRHLRVPPPPLPRLGPRLDAGPPMGR